jgi:hypothetical protein
MNFSHKSETYSIIEAATNSINPQITQIYTEKKICENLRKSVDKKNSVMGFSHKSETYSIRGATTKLINPQITQIYTEKRICENLRKSVDKKNITL